MQDVLQILGEGSLDELKEVVLQLEKADKLIAEINAESKNIDLSMRGNKSLKETVSAMEAVQANTAAMEKAIVSYDRKANEIFKNLKKLSEDQQQAVIKELNLNEQVRKSLDERLKLQNAVAKAQIYPVDSIKGMSAELSKLRKEYDALSKAERESAAVGEQKLKQIQSLDAEIKSLEGSTGRFQRNVGNYEGALTPIQRQVQLIAGELPNLQFGFRTFFQSLSNQIAGFSDAIRQTVAANKALKAEGKETVSVFRQVVTAFGGWQVALLAVAGILPVLFEQLFKNTEQEKKMSEATKENSEAQKKLTEQIGREVSELTYLTLQASDANRSYDERGKAVDELQKKFPEYFGALSREAILNGDVKVAVDGVTRAIINRVKEMQRVEQLNKVISEIAAAELELEKITKRSRGTFVIASQDEVQALKNKIEQLNIERKKIEDGIQSTTDFGVNDAYWIDKNAKSRYEAAQERQKQNALLTEEERKNLEKSAKDAQKAIEDNEKARQKAIEALRASVAGFKLSFQRPNESELKQDIEAFQNQLDASGSEVYLKARVDLSMGKVGEAVSESQSKSNERMLGIELAFQNGLFKTYEEYEKAKTEETYNSTKERTQIQIDGLKALLSYLPENSNERKRFAKELSEIELNAAVTTSQKIKADSDEREKDRKGKQLKAIDDFDQWSRRALEVAADLATVFSNIYQKQIESIEEANAAIEKNLSKEIEAIKAKGLSQKQEEEEIAVVKAKAAVAEEKNNKKIAEYRTRQAQLDKAISIASIIQNTAVAVMQFWSKGNIPLAIAAGIAGAAQVAAVASRPIPKYEKGTNDSEGGPAVVSEKGHELVIEPDGRRWLTPATESVVMLKKHSKIIPNHQLVEMSKTEMANSNIFGFRNEPVFDDTKIVDALVRNNDGIRLVYREMQKTNALMKKQSQIPNYGFRDGYFKSIYN